MARAATIRGRGGRRWRLVRARREAVTSAMRRVNQPGRGPRLRRVIPWLAAVVVAGVAAWIVLFTSVLAVREVVVTGSHIAGEDQIRAIAAVADGTPLARVDTGAIEDRLRALPSVASANVRRSWPHTLVLEITERVPAGVVAAGGGYVVIDAAGVVFDRVADRPPGVMLIRLAAPGPSDPSTMAALRVLAALTPTLRAQTIEVVAESPVRIRLELEGGRIVVWGDAERNDAKARVATSLLPRPGRTIDVSAPEVATVSGP